MGLKSKVAGETGELEEPMTGEVQILLTSKEDSVSMRSLGVSGFGFVLVWLLVKHWMTIEIEMLNIYLRLIGILNRYDQLSLA